MLNWHWPTKQRYVDMKLGPQSKDYKGQETGYAAHPLLGSKCLAKCLDRFLNVKAVAANFNQEKTLVGPSLWLYNFKLHKGSFQALESPHVNIEYPPSGSVSYPGLL